MQFCSVTAICANVFLLFCSDRKIRPMLPIKTKHGLKERNIVMSDSEEEEEEEEKEKEMNGQEKETEESGKEEKSMAGKEVSIVELYAKRKVRITGISARDFSEIGLSQLLKIMLYRVRSSHYKRVNLTHKVFWQIFGRTTFYN
jgi:hypothetical protein